MHCYSNYLSCKQYYYPYLYQSFYTMNIPKSVDKIMVDTYRIMINIDVKISLNL